MIDDCVISGDLKYNYINVIIRCTQSQYLPEKHFPMTREWRETPVRARALIQTQVRDPLFRVHKLLLPTELITVVAVVSRCTTFMLPP